MDSSISSPCRFSIYLFIYIFIYSLGRGWAAFIRIRACAVLAKDFAGRTTSSWRPTACFLFSSSYIVLFFQRVYSLRTRRLLDGRLLDSALRVALKLAAVCIEQLLFLSHKLVDPATVFAILLYFS